MSGFVDFVSTELPKRPFTTGDGSAGQTLVRSSNPLATREMVWADLPGTAASTLAAQALSGHIAVVLDADGRATPASADTPEHQFVEAITTGAANAGAAVGMRDSGFIDHDGWSFTPMQMVYLGMSGQITQTVPPEALFVKVLGLALTATRIKVDFQTAIFF